MARATIELKGLEEVKKSLSTKRIKKVVRQEVGTAALHLHSVLRDAVFNRYTAKNDLDKRLVRGSSLTSFGKNVIERSLVYNVVAADLSRFPTTWYWGNINSGARRPGRVHIVEVIRGQPKVVHGKDHRGGFQPRGKGGVPIRIFRGGSQMLERVSRAKFPLRVLYGPNTANMINWALDNDSKVRNTLNEFEANVLRVIA